MLQVLQKFLNTHIGILDQGPEQTPLQLLMQGNRKGNGRTLFSQDDMTAGLPVEPPAGLDEGFDSFFSGDNGKLSHKKSIDKISDDYLNNPALSLELPHPILSKRFKAPDYGLFDVLQSLLDGLALRVTPWQCWAANDVATFFCLLNDDLEFHVLELVKEVEKGFASRESELCNNDPVLFRKYLDPDFLAVLEIQNFHDPLLEVKSSRTVFVDIDPPNRYKTGHSCSSPNKNFRISNLYIVIRNRKVFIFTNPYRNGKKVGG